MTNIAHRSRVLIVLWNPGTVPDLEWRATVTATQTMDLATILPSLMTIKPQLVAVAVQRLITQAMIVVVIVPRLLIAQ